MEEKIEDNERTNMNREEDNVVSLDRVNVHFDENSGVFERLFSEPNSVRAVDGVDLKIKNQDTVVLVGESGCGKTTLGKTVVGEQKPTSGSVKYRGQDIWKAKFLEDNVQISYKEIRRSLQMIHQDPGSALNPNKTIQSILSRPLKKWAPNLSKKDRLSRIHGLLQHVGMTPPDNYISRYPHQLSGGEQQRVALTRALLMNPDLIMADEALSALDVSLRVDMMDLFVDIQEQFNTSFLFISHNISNARYIAQRMNGRIAIMYLGEIVEIGSADDVLKNPEHPYTNALKWAAPRLDPNQGVADEPPIRDIDVPDPANPPSGCRFHTRCPEAHEVCKSQHPDLKITEENANHMSACFRAFGENHEYWDSPSIVEED